MSPESFDIKSNKCEICNRVATAGILDDFQEGKIRYTCQDHYIHIYDRIASERKNNK